MKMSKLLFPVAAVAGLLLASSTAHATRFYFSTSATAPTENTLNTAGDENAIDVGVNPAFVGNVGDVFTLYLWVELTSGHTIDGFGHDLLVTDTFAGGDAISWEVSPAASYTVDNPVIFGISRWGSVGKGTDSGTGFVTNDANFAKVGGSLLGQIGTLDILYHAASNSTRLAQLKIKLLSPGLTGLSELRLGIGFEGISFPGQPDNTPVFFGFGDAGVPGDARDTTLNGNPVGSSSTVADATFFVPIPEPSTIALLGLGSVVLIVARRRRKA